MHIRYIFFRYFFFCFIFLNSCEQTKKPSIVPPAIGVTEFVIEPKSIPAVFNFLGFAESAHQVEIRGRVEGFLDKINYQEGQMVKEGDILFQLDPKQFKAKVADANGEVARQQALLANANLTANRLSALYKENAASKKDLDNAISDQLSAQAQLESAQAQLLNAEINLGYTTIISPISGIADRSRLREGSLINPSSNSLLTTISKLDPIWIYFTISDSDILSAKRHSADHSIIFPSENGYQVEATMSDGSLFPHKGSVNFSSPTYDQSSGTILARASFPNPNGDIRPGQFIRVKVYGAERPHAITVPQRALMQKSNGMFVYLIDPNGSVVVQNVSTGQWEGDYQVITNGLKAGDRLVVDGINKINPGTSVKVIGAWTPSTTLKGQGR
jgi:membrane fusion protein, multidrug efflux system